MICDYGCGKEAKYEMTSGKWCCENSFFKCPGYKQKVTSVHNQPKKKCPKCGLMIIHSMFKRHLDSCSMHPCAECENLILKHLKFCNHSCSAKFNNKKQKTKKCLNCNTLIYKHQTYCNLKCFHTYKYNERIAKWLQNPDSFDEHKGFMKKWLIETYGEKCIHCGWNEINSYSKIIPIEMHHKDGHSENNHPDNLELICPSCHSLTSTYKGMNMGNGRKKRMIEYHKK